MSVYQTVFWQMPVLAQKFMGVWPYDSGTIYSRMMPIFVYLSVYGMVVPMVSCDYLQSSIQTNSHTSFFPQIICI